MLLDARNPDDRDKYHALLGRLVQSGRPDLAWNLYTQRGLAPRGATAQSVRNGSLEAAEDGSPFDWSVVEDPELWASRERLGEAGGYVLRLAGYNGRSGEVARQYLNLAPGLHQMRARAGDIPAEAHERPELRLECASGAQGRVLASVVPSGSGAAARELSAAFTVPSDCRFQRLGIHIAGDGPLKDSLPWVDDFRIN